MKFSLLGHYRARHFFLNPYFDFFVYSGSFAPLSQKALAKGPFRGKILFA
jgi:hypothetical protein